jgi:hypothetical protein
MDKFIIPTFSNNEFNNNWALTTGSDPFVASCSAGEYIFNPGNYCIACSNGTFALQPNSTQCFPCPDNANCLGNYYNLIGNKYYWT